MIQYLACSLCQKWPVKDPFPKTTLCHSCWHELIAQRCQVRRSLDEFLIDGLDPFLSARMPVLAMFPYQDAIRNLIRRIKVEDSQYALQDVLVAWLESDTLHRWAAWSDVAMAVPGSLWSRLRLKVDLGERLLSAVTVNERAVWPMACYWRRWRKQSFRRRKQRHLNVGFEGSSYLQRRLPTFYADLVKNRPEACQRPLRLLLIDDLLTSGQTLKDFLPRSVKIDVRIAVLAYGRNHDKKIGSA